MDLRVVDAADRFLDRLAGVTDPERKRKIVGHEFIEVFREEAKQIEGARFLGQGTLYPDVIESVAAHGGNTAVIKSHHNVGGLPEDLDMELVEPLRELFKDEVRVIGRFMGLAEELVERQPFPGPGLSVRIVGEVTREHVTLLQEADAIVTYEIEAAGASAACGSTSPCSCRSSRWGVMGDLRTYEKGPAALGGGEGGGLAGGVGRRHDRGLGPPAPRAPGPDLESDHQRGPRDQSGGAGHQFQASRDDRMGVNPSPPAP